MTDSENNTTENNSEDDDNEYWGNGHQLIGSMDDLEKAMKILRLAQPGLSISAAWINTGGYDMPHALTRGVLRGIPIHTFGEIMCTDDAITLCNTEKYKESITHSWNSDIANPTIYIASLVHNQPCDDRPHSDKCPYDWSASRGVFHTWMLESAGLLLHEKTADAAPDCLLLIDDTSGLALPVPIGMMLVWTVWSKVFRVYTYCPRKQKVSDSTDYSDMDVEFNPHMLCEEATASERYIARLLAHAEQMEEGKKKADEETRAQYGDHYPDNVAEATMLLETHGLNPDDYDVGAIADILPEFDYDEYTPRLLDRLFRDHQLGGPHATPPTDAEILLLTCNKNPDDYDVAALDAYLDGQESDMPAIEEDIMDDYATVMARYRTAPPRDDDTWDPKESEKYGEWKEAWRKAHPHYEDTRIDMSGEYQAYQDEINAIRRRHRADRIVEEEETEDDSDPDPDPDSDSDSDFDGPTPTEPAA